MSELVERLRKQAVDAVDWDGETLKRWDEIRGMVETRKGSDLPRLMFEAMIENLAELITDAAVRIEALEAALRKIAEWPPSSRIDDIIGAFIDAKLFARAALDKDAG